METYIVIALLVSIIFGGLAGKTRKVPMYAVRTQVYSLTGIAGFVVGIAGLA